jgi:GNAT superfamily N-acetyltransferase
MDGPRASRADELSAVVALSGAVFARSGRRDMSREYPTLLCRENLPHLRVFVEGGRPVALAGFTLNRLVTAGISLAAACIGSVCTLEACRGRGLGTRLMDDCVAAALSAGASLLLVSGGRGLYRRMGCIDAGQYRTIRVPRAATRREPRRRTREWRLADVPRMADLHRSEPVRFERSLPEWYAFLRTGNVSDRPCRTWVVSAPGKPEAIDAYLCVQRTVDTPEGRTASVQETGGSREAAVAALASVAEGMHADRIEVDCPAADTALAANAAGLDGFVFRHGVEAFAVRGLEEVTAFLFGSIERRAVRPGPGPLRARLEAAFPIPLPDYGLNYIEKTAWLRARTPGPRTSPTRSRPRS